MTHAITAEELEPGMKLHVDGKVLIVHTRPYFWLSDTRGFICARDDSRLTSETIDIFKGERLVVE